MLLEDQLRSNRRRSALLFAAFLLIYALMGAAVSLAVAGWHPELNLVVLAGYALGATLLTLFTLLAGDDLAASVAAGGGSSRATRPPSCGTPSRRWRSRPASACRASTSPPILADKEELEGVAAHEIAHIRNLDVRVMTYASALAGSVAIIAELLFKIDFLDLDGPWWFALVRGVVYFLAILLAPLAALVVQMAVSRRREFLADATAADLTRYPQGLASALRQIAAAGVAPQRSLNTITHMCIVPPGVVSGKSERLFASHPPLAERLARLDGLANSQLHEHRPRERSDAIEEMLGA